MGRLPTGTMLVHVLGRWRHKRLHEQTCQRKRPRVENAPIGNLLLVNNTIASTCFSVGVSLHALLRALVGALSVGICSELIELSIGRASAAQRQATHEMKHKHVEYIARLRGCTCVTHTCQALLVEGYAGSILLDRFRKSCSATYNFAAFGWHQGLVPSQPQHRACPNTQCDAVLGKHKQRS